jgi:hypothetical protein
MVYSDCSGREASIVIIRKTLIALSLLGLAACGGPDPTAKVPQAEPAGASSASIGDHVVHFSAQTTDQLRPEVARAYNIMRSPNRAMLNVAVVRAADDVSVEAQVSVKTVNLTGQLKNVTMRQINEQDAVYYIGETPVANQETLVFDITVLPDGANAAAEVRFKRQFYTN